MSRHMSRAALRGSIRRLVPWIASALIATSSAFATVHTHQTIIGQNDPAVDRQALQDAIDSAAPFSTIRLVGTFQLDGERIEITTSGLRLLGEAIDDDGDGAVQEDWADGLDNDGDGAIDEDDWDTVLQGVEAPGGGPANDRGQDGMFNRGLTIEGRRIHGLVVRDLHFKNLYRAIELLPEWATPTGECDDRTRVNGVARNLFVKRNRFSDNTLGITLLGSVRNAVVNGNVFERHGIFGIVTEGNRVTCPLPGDDGVPLDLSTPRFVVMRNNQATGGGGFGSASTIFVTVTGNHIADATVGYLAISDRFLRLRDNTITSASAGIATLGEGSRATIRGNTIEATFVGIDAADPVERVRIVDNDIGGGFWGLLLSFDASGYEAIDNRLSGNLLVDVELDDTTSGNVVIHNLEPAITVTDTGTDNRVEGNVIPF